MLFALLLAGCEASPDYPRLVDASATCDEAELSWRLSATVEHERGPERIVSTFFDLAILFSAGNFADAEPIGSHELGHEGEALWAVDLPRGTTPLQCGFDGEYLLTITAEDDDGDQAAAQIRIDGLGNPSG